MKMTIKEIREKSGMSRAEFSRQYNIPVRTLEDWEYEKRKCPDYVENLLQRAVLEDCKTIKLYDNSQLLRELGSCYAELLSVMNYSKGWSHNPYPHADVFPAKYFTMVFMTAVKLNIPPDLNERIGNLMNFIDPDDWANSMNTPCPLESRIYFDIGMTDKHVS